MTRFFPVASPPRRSSPPTPPRKPRDTDLEAPPIRGQNAAMDVWLAEQEQHLSPSDPRVLFVSGLVPPAPSARVEFAWIAAASDVSKLRIEHLQAQRSCRIPSHVHRVDSFCAPKMVCIEGLESCWELDVVAAKVRLPNLQGVGEVRLTECQVAPDLPSLEHIGHLELIRSNGDGDDNVSDNGGLPIGVEHLMERADELTLRNVEPDTIPSHLLGRVTRFEWDGAYGVMPDGLLEQLEVFVVPRPDEES